MPELPDRSIALRMAALQQGNAIRSERAVNRNEEAVELLHRLRDLCEENSLMGEQINEWLEELRDA